MLLFSVVDALSAQSSEVLLLSFELEELSLELDDSLYSAVDELLKEFSEVKLLFSDLDDEVLSEFNESSAFVPEESLCSVSQQSLEELFDELSLSLDDNLEESLEEALYSVLDVFLEELSETIVLFSELDEL